MGGSLSVGVGTDLVLIAARVTLGGMVIAHGHNHLFGPGGVSGTASWFRDLGFRPARVHALASGWTELACGLLLLLGLLTPFACAGLVGVMAVAGVSAHRLNGFFVFRPGQGYEYVLVVAVFAVLLATIGPGTVSMDQLLGVVDYRGVDQRLVGWPAAAVSLGGGLGGAAAVLVTGWRPNRGGGEQRP